MYKPILKTRFIGKNLDSLSTCHSTNDIAAQKVRGGQAENGDIIITREQTAGRGQRGAVWESEPGMNLTFSVIVMPEDFPVSDRFLLSQWVAVGVHAYVASLAGEAARIKWPNDILLGQKKMTGISIDTVIRGSKIASAVIGIGMNVNQTVFGSERITSLSRFSGRYFDLEEAFEQLVLSLDSRYDDLVKGRLDSISTAYRENLFALGEARRFRIGDELVTGVVAGTSGDGRLRVRFDEAEQLFDIKEIVWHW